MSAQASAAVTPLLDDAEPDDVEVEEPELLEVDPLVLVLVELPDEVPVVV